MTTVKEHLLDSMKQKDRFAPLPPPRVFAPTKDTIHMGRIDTRLPDLLIDVTMTVGRRPEMLKATLHSVYKYALAPIIEHCRMVINVEPEGDDIASHELSKVVEAFFKRYSIKMPLECSFPKALKWVWTNTDAPYILHLTEGYVLRRPVDISAMIFRMPGDKLASTGLPGELPKLERFSILPMLMKGDFARTCADVMIEDLNIDTQIRQDHHKLHNVINSHHHLLWGTQTTLC